VRLTGVQPTGISVLWLYFRFLFMRNYLHEGTVNAAVALMPRIFLFLFVLIAVKEVLNLILETSAEVYQPCAR
jgi:hypothetical protein